ncbi:MAG: hypothetical protein WD181_03030 [Solirubrobacterales bacterium]
MNEYLKRAESTRAQEIVTRPDGLVSRLYGLPALHRLLPALLAVRLAKLRGSLEWRLIRSRRDQARQIAVALTGEPEGSEAVARFGRKYRQEKAMQSELSLRPWMARKMPVEGAAGLRKAIASGRGVLLAGMHFGPMLSLHHALAHHGFKVYLSGGHPPEEWMPDGFSGRWVKMQNIWIEELGHRWVHLGGSYPVLRAVLEDGGVCWLAWDTKGSDLETTYLGRTVRVPPGLARLHLETGAPILPAVSFREGSKMRGFVGPPLNVPKGGDEVLINRILGETMSAIVRPRLAQAHFQSAQLIERGGLVKQ